MKKNRISDSAKKQFLALLRAGLWGKEADMRYFPEGSTPDWNGILYLGRTQAVLPLVYDGMLTLPPDRQLKGPALMKLLAYVDKIAGTCRAVQESAAQTVRRHRPVCRRRELQESGRYHPAVA